jgi:hypothetical protein
MRSKEPYITVTRMPLQVQHPNVVAPPATVNAVQRASLFLLIVYNMPNPFSVVFKRKKKAGLARTASHQSTSSVSSLAASPTPVRMSLRTVRSANPFDLDRCRRIPIPVPRSWPPYEPLST